MFSKGHWKWQAQYIGANFDNITEYTLGTSKEKHSSWRFKSKKSDIKHSKMIKPNIKT